MKRPPQKNWTVQTSDCFITWRTPLCDCISARARVCVWIDFCVSYRKYIQMHGDDRQKYIKAWCGGEKKRRKGSKHRGRDQGTIWGSLQTLWKRIKPKLSFRTHAELLSATMWDELRLIKEAPRAETRYIWKLICPHLDLRADKDEIQTPDPPSLPVTLSNLIEN